jgi:4-amino-4-deoxy-L-arabinose transferase-like glycosyltransferase
VVAVLVALLVVVAAYVLHRAWVLRLEYYDGYSYLKFAQRLLGGPEIAFEVQRPPGLPLLQVPFVALAMRGGPANPWLLVAPHLASACLSLLALAALYFAFSPALGRRGALLGVLLFAASRWFVRYAPFVMTDLPTAGCCAAAVGCYLRARQGRAWALYLAGGAAAGLGIVLKPTAVFILPALGLAEVLRALRPGSERARRLVGTTLLVAAAAAVAAGLYWLTFRILGPEQVWTRIHGAVFKASLMQLVPGDARKDYFELLPQMVPWPVLALAMAGLVLAATRRRGPDLPFALWLALMGAGIVGGLRHTEARYLIPVAPPIFYFAARAAETGLEALSARLAGARAAPRALAALALCALLVLCLSSGLRQAWADRDPVFTTDRQRRSVELVQAARRGEGRLWLLGEWHTLNPRDRGPAPTDEFWNCFHFSRQGAEYLLGRPFQLASRATFLPDARRFDLAALFQDGDAVLRLDNAAFMTAAFPKNGELRPLEVWSVRKTELARQRGYRLASAGSKLTGTLQVEGRKALRFLPDGDAGRGWLYERRGLNPTLLFSASTEWKRGRPIPLSRPHDDLTGLGFVQIERQPIP